MNKLYINKQLVDYADSPLLNKEYSSVNELENTSETYFSFDIELPLSDRNKQVFNFINTFDVINKFNKLYPAELYCNEVLILDGYFLIDNIGDNISGNLYQPKSTVLSEILGNTNLNDIESISKEFKDISSINTINSSNDKLIKFPYILYNYPYNIEDTTLSNNQQEISSNNNLTVDKILPVYNTLEIIKLIFKQNNYTISGNIFEDPMFTELYQTFNIDAEDYYNATIPSYRLEFDYSWSNLNRNNLTQRNTMCIGKKMDFGSDDPDDVLDTITYSVLKSSPEFLSINEIDNDYYMLAQSADGLYQITIPEDGWYRLTTTPNLQFPEYQYVSGITYRDPILGVNLGVLRGGANNANQFITSTVQYPINYTFAQNVYEMHFTKSNDISTSELISSNFTEPVQYQSVNTEKTFEDFGNTIQNTVFASNQMNFSNVSRAYPMRSSEDFLCLKWGAYRHTQTVNHRYESNRISKLGNIYNLPNPSKVDAYPKEHLDAYPDIQVASYLKLYDYGDYINNKDWGSSTAQILFDEDAYMNYSRYSQFYTDGNFEKQADEKLHNQSINGLSDSRIFVEDNTKANLGTANVDGLFWFNKGDSVNINIVSQAVVVPLNNLNHTTGTPEMIIDSKVILEYINNDLEYNFYANGIESISDDLNVTNLLPDENCNDFLNNFLTTFGLSLTALSSDSFSIDYTEDTNSSIIIDFNNYVHIDDVSFNKIDFYATNKLEFTNDFTEEGYRETQYDGSGVIINPTNTTQSENLIQSDYSYNWYKNIEFMNNGEIAYSEDVPIICNEDIWANSVSYPTAIAEGLYTDATPRYLYLKDDYITIDTEKVAVNLFKTTNSKYNLSLTYDYNIEDSISNKLFSKPNINSYELTFSCYLPISEFIKIKNNTKGLLNGNLFRITKVEGFDPDLKQMCNITLQS